MHRALLALLFIAILGLVLATCAASCTSTPSRPAFDEASPAPAAPADRSAPTAVPSTVPPRPATGPPADGRSAVAAVRDSAAQAAADLETAVSPAPTGDPKEALVAVYLRACALAGARDYAGARAALSSQDLDRSMEQMAVDDPSLPRLLAARIALLEAIGKLEDADLK